jgi:hypothetical protein
MRSGAVESTHPADCPVPRRRVQRCPPTLTSSRPSRFGPEERAVRHARPPRGGGRLDEAIHTEIVAKPRGGTRLLTRLGERDRWCFERAVAAVVPVVERGLAPGVLANRASVGAHGVDLQPWPAARRRFQREIALAAVSSRAAFVGDVLECYASISVVAVERALADLGATPDDVARVSGVLRSFEERGVHGLPVGPAPSAVLANAVLTSVDRAMRTASDSPVFRWVDDVVAFTSGRLRAVHVAEAFHRTLEDVGLVGHPTKCLVTLDTAEAVAGASAASGVRGRGRGMMRRP